MIKNNKQTNIKWMYSLFVYHEQEDQSFDNTKTNTGRKQLIDQSKE